MIEVQRVSKSFGDNVVLKQIDVVFEPGKVNMIIGGSGSGKSTLLKCIVGLHKPDEGKVFFDGQEFTSIDSEEKVRVRKELCMLFQNSAFFVSLTIEQKIVFTFNLFTNFRRNDTQEHANLC